MLRRLPISVNGTGDFSVTPAGAAGTTYDGATRTLRARKRVRPGRRPVDMPVAVPHS